MAKHTEYRGDSRQYTLTIPVAVANQVKATAKARAVTEHQLLMEMVMLGSAAMNLAEQQAKDKALEEKAPKENQIDGGAEESRYDAQGY